MLTHGGIKSFLALTSFTNDDFSLSRTSFEVDNRFKIETDASDYKNIIPFIPSRAEQGYGLSEKSLTSILEMVTSKNDLKTIRLQNLKPLIISVDCGIKDIELIDEKWGLIFDFIINFLPLSL